MASIKLIEISRGWDWFPIPDDITIQIEFKQDHTCVCVSLQDLCLIYYLISEEESDSLIVGIGLNMSIVKKCVLIGNEVVFKDRRPAEKSFKNIIFEIFSEKDKVDPENREKALSEIDDRIQSDYNYNGLKITKLYEEYRQQPGT